MSNTDKEKALSFMSLQSQHLRLMCQNYPEKVLDRVQEITKGKIKFALDKCLEICEEFKQIEACAILTNKMTNYLSSATWYISLLTKEDLFNYPILIKQVSQSPKIPHFIPYPGKNEKLKNKDIMKNGLDQSLIIRFDYIVRKVMKICARDSTENFSEETIDKMWFFALDQIFKIKNEQIKMLKKIKDTKVDNIT